MNEKTITLTRHALFDLILRYENEVTCAKELPVFLDRVMNGNDETAEIDYDAQGKAGERVKLVSDGLFRCRQCGDYFREDEVMEIREYVDGMVLFSHECIPCKREQDYGAHPKEGEHDITTEK